MFGVLSVERNWIAPFLVAAAVVFSGLGSSPLWDRDEPRNARCAAEMLARHDPIVPTFNGELRTHKPPLLYWGQMAAFRWLGTHEWSARLPSALAGLTSVLATYVLARRFVAPGAAGWSSLAVGTMLMMTMASRAATPDALLIASVAWTITAWSWSAWETRSTTPDAEGFYPLSAVRPSRLQWCLIWSLSGIAVLAKGPVGLVLPASIIGGCELARCWDTNPERSLIRRSIGSISRAIGSMSLPWAVICVLLVAGPWYLAVGLATDGRWLREFFFEHNVGRAMNSMEGHTGPGPLFYLMTILVGTFPWSAFALPVFLRAVHLARTHPASRPMFWLAMVWVVLFVAAFSLAATKLPSYITPCYPALALVYGHWLWQVAVQPTSQPRWLVAGLLVGAAIGLSTVIAIGVLPFEPLGSLRLLSLVGLAMLSGSLLALALARRGMTQLAVRSYAVGAVLMVGLLFSLGPALAGRSRADLAMLSERFATFPDEQYVALGGSEPSWIFYAARPIPELDAEELRMAADELQAGRCVIARTKQAHRLSDHCTERGIAVEQISAAPRFLEQDQILLLRRR